MMNVDRFFNMTALPQIIVDPERNELVAANQEACRLLGKDHKELITEKVSNLFKENLPSFIVFTQEAMERSRAWSDSIHIETSNAHERIEISARYIIAGDERLLSLSMQLVNELDNYRKESDAERHYQSGIGHWNRIARTFQEFERHNQLLLDAAGEGIYGVDANGKTTFTNPAAQEILGYSAEELAGKNMHHTVHHSHADGSHFGPEECPIFAAFRDGKVQKVDDDVFWSKSGKPIFVEYTSTPIEDSGYIVGAVVVFRDISEKKANEQQLLEALEEVESLKNRLEMEKAYLEEEIRSEFNQHQMIGSSFSVQKTLRQIELVGPTEATVLISGESGTGKELIARAIHETSHRSERPLIRVNCAAIPAELFESEFFGHTKGAFTGATSDRTGRFDLANGGTLFLDEVGEIPLHLQGKLLRVLQEQQFERIGEGTTRKVDVRIIAATNRNLKEQVEAGKFREDLYFRLNVFPVESVPLRKRKEDIPLLTQHFLKKACTRANKLGLKIPLSELEKLNRYEWPGNIRELENVIERQVILTSGQIVRFDTILGNTDTSETDLPINSNSDSDSDSDTTVLTDKEIRLHERSNILRALKLTQGKVSGELGAAALLDIKPTTLASRIKKLNIEKHEFSPAPASS